MKKQILLLVSTIMFGGVITFTSCKADTAGPVITVSGGNTQSQNLPATAGTGTWINPTATATDDVDGNITNIQVTGTVDPNTAGTYTLTYSAVDATGHITNQTVTVNIVNAADFLEGTYSNCHDSCQVSGTFNYTSIVTASNTVNGAFVVNNFGGFGMSVNVNASLSGSSISMTAGESLGGGGSIVSGTGTVTSTTPPQFGLTYTWTDGSATESCASVYQ